MRHKRNIKGIESTTSLIEFEELNHPISKEQCMDVYLRYAPNAKVWIAWCKKEYDLNTRQNVYQTYGLETDLIPLGSDLESVKKDILKHERTFIEQEIKYRKEHGRHVAPRMLTKRLRALNRQHEPELLLNSENEQQLSTHKKTNTMETQNQKTKNEKPVSRLYLVEKGTWKNDQEVITFYYKNAEGKPKAIGHVYVHYDKEGQTFGSQDARGNDLFPPCSNRYELKKQFLDNEQNLIQKFEQQQEQQKNQSQQNPSQINQPAQVQQPANNPEQKQKPTRQNRRKKNELSEIRQDKNNNEKEQSITH